MRLPRDPRVVLALFAAVGLAVVGVPALRAQEGDDPAPPAVREPGEERPEGLPPVVGVPPVPIPEDDEPLPDPSKPAPAKRPPAKKPGDTTRPTKRLGDREQGKMWYERSCWQCHGASGRGDGPAASALVGGVPSLEGRIRSKDAERLEDMDALVRAVQDGKGRMPAYSEDIDKADTRRILLYVRDVLEGKGAVPPPTDDADEPSGGDGDAPGG